MSAHGATLKCLSALRTSDCWAKKGEATAKQGSEPHPAHNVKKATRAIYAAIDHLGRVDGSRAGHIRKSCGAMAVSVILLKNKLGRVLCVLEAKREDLDLMPSSKRGDMPRTSRLS
jgi:hypothetical protein